MKGFLTPIAVLLLVIPACSLAQASRTFDWQPVAAAGALPLLDLRPSAQFGQSLISSNYTVSVSLGEGANSVCTWQLEASDDAVNWYSVSGVQSCTAPLMFSVANRPARMLRPNVLTYSGTASLKFYWTGCT